ncbi:FucTD [Drosophila busckii]|uniref:Fucosyltransferase n=1 Tax=Drosophila busckii TaxID=30019 RepID=A0A0M5J7R5_DROBS|nr:FucTD [Drosophila busckii]
MKIAEKFSSVQPSSADGLDSGGESDLLSLAPPLRSPVSSTIRRRFRIGQYLSNIKFLVLIVTIYVLLHLLPRHHASKQIHETNRSVVLLWNEHNSSQAGEDYIQCGCRITSNRKYAQSLIEAVVVHADRPYSLDGLENIEHTPDYLVVFTSKTPVNPNESPITAKNESVFNFTMTYRLDSDLIWTDFYFYKTKVDFNRQLAFDAPDENFMEKLSSFAATELRSKLNAKNRLILYMMYEVNANTLAESLYLEQIREYAELDAYASCQKNTHCIVYHFMLVFESSTCPDYLNPQFFMALTNYVVPVVLGGGDLSHIAPPGSYISADDFYSPQQLWWSRYQCPNRSEVWSWTLHPLI